ncbi:MAG: ATP-binding protein [Truepera sp.]|nr:ATP-binding protein [Truepera sp.]
MHYNSTYLGTVQDVQGATVSVALDKDTISGLVFIDGHGYRIGQIGSFIRIPIGFVDLFGIVSQVGAGAVPETLAHTEPYGYRWLKVQLIGEGQRSGPFQRGVSQYPTINDEAHLVTEQDLTKIYGKPDEPGHVRIGGVASAESIPALVDVNRLVTRHCAVLGTTGAGKSTTVANLLASFSDQDRYPSARIIVLDIHGEYHTALKDRATIFRINADTSRDEEPLFVPYWALSFDELLRVTPFGGVSDTDRVALVDQLKRLKLASLQAKSRSGVTPDTMTVDTPIPFSIHRFWYELYRDVLSHHTAQGVNQTRDTEAIACDAEGEKLIGDIMTVQPPEYLPITAGGSNRVYLSASSLNIRRQLVAVESRLKDTRYDFLFRPGPWCPEPSHQDLNAQPTKDLDALLESWLGGNKPITILDLSGVPELILMDLIGVLLRLLFDALFWGRHLPEGGRRRPLLIVLEEAHSYLGVGNIGPAATAARRVVREGRKYGLGAMIVSQRPSEIDSTILSQCGTIFAMRLANDTDRSHVAGVVSDNLEGLLSMLPALRTGEAIVIGEAVHLPLRAIVDAPAKNRRPDSDDPLIYDPDAARGWSPQRQSKNYNLLLEKWRSENPKSTQDSGVKPCEEPQ